MNFPHSWIARGLSEWRRTLFFVPRFTWCARPCATPYHHRIASVWGVFYHSVANLLPENNVPKDHRIGFQSSSNFIWMQKLWLKGNCWRCSHGLTRDSLMKVHQWIVSKQLSRFMHSIKSARFTPLSSGMMSHDVMMMFDDVSWCLMMSRYVSGCLMMLIYVSQSPCFFSSLEHYLWIHKSSTKTQSRNMGFVCGFCGVLSPFIVFLFHGCFVKRTKKIHAEPWRTKRS